MDRQLEEFRREVRRVRKEQTGRGYPAAMRSFAVRYAAQRLAQSVPMTQVVEELGVSEPTLREWRKDAPAELLPVVVQPNPAEATDDLESTATPADAAVRPRATEPGPHNEPLARPRADEAVPPAAAGPPRLGASLTLVSPRGWRLAGLDLEVATALLKELG